MQIKIYATIEVPDDTKYKVVEDEIDYFLGQLVESLNGEVTDLEIK